MEPVQTTNPKLIEVVKNVTYVNDVLQELIKNYQKLQKLSKIYSSFETDHDEEESEVFNKVPPNKKKQIKEKATTKKKVFPATQMLVSEDENSEADSQKTEEMADTLGKNGIPYIESLKADDNIKLSTSKRVENLSEQTSSEVASEETSAASSNKSEIIFIKTHNDVAFATTKRPLEPRVDNEKKESKVEDVATLEVTDNDSTCETTEQDSLADQIRQLRQKNNRDTTIQPNYNNILRGGKANWPVKKTVYVESFPSGNIWFEIINKKPITLKTQKEILYVPEGVNLNGSIKTVIIVRKKQLAYSFPNLLSYIVLFQSNILQTEESARQSMSMEDLVKQEQVRTNVLRKAYGDACLKVVVKKCYKACRATIKVVCTKYSCKRGFKQFFLQYAKKGCSNQFIPNTTVNFRVGSDVNNLSGSPTAENGFTDITRGGYLEAACLPKPAQSKVSKKVTLRNQTKIVPQNLGKYESELKILRDRYERACQRASSAKCQEACRYAADGACSSFSCKGGRKSFLRKTCKSQCRRAYYLGSSSSSSSETHSDDDDYSSLSTD